MTFRHPLRNDWDRLKAQFEQTALGASQAAYTARAMLKLVPPLLDVIEAQRDANLSGEQKLSALFAVIGMLVENTIEASYRTRRNRNQALTAMLSRIDTIVRPRLLASASNTTTGGSGLILPH